MTLPITLELKDPPAVPPALPYSSTTAQQAREWMGVMMSGLRTQDTLLDTRVPPREPILGEWFRQGDLGFIYGPRGLGKTWIALYISRRIAQGQPVGCWACPRPRKVLYVDGEMPIDGLYQRDKALSSALSAGDTDNMIFLQHESLFENSGAVLNFADPGQQRAMSDLCRDKGVEVLVLDNLSCLFSGVKENDANEWEKVLPWLLSLRRRRIAVVFIAHAGRNGYIRGTSRREDAAFWILQLTAPDQEEGPADAARFVARFDKNRNSTERECPPVEWCFAAGASGQAEVTWRPVTGLEKFRQWVEAGLTSATDIAIEMGLSKGRVSQLSRIAMAQGWLRRDGREYALVSGAHVPGVLSREDADAVLSGAI